MTGAVSKVGTWAVLGVLLIVALVGVVLVLNNGVGQGTHRDAAYRQVGTFTVIDSGSGSDGGGRSAVLCGDAVMESHPPQCQGKPISGWDWTAVESFEEASGVRWGEYDLAVIPEGNSVRVIVAESVEGAAEEEAADLFQPSAEWINEGRTFELVTYGSSSCPYLVVRPEVIRSDQIVLRMVLSGGEVCTADYAPNAQTVELPAGALERPLSVFLDYADTNPLVKLTLP